MRFSTWLRGSNEAQPIREAMRLIDEMPDDFGLKRACFWEAQRIAESVWADTKRDLDL